MAQTVRQARRLRGTITPPGDKSISHRAALFNAIADGEAVVENFLRGADCLATLNVLRKLGVYWRWRGDSTLYIRGAGRDGLREPESILDCRNSGTSIRLLTGLLAGQRDMYAVLTGDASLRSRPMGRVIKPLQQMGASIDARVGGSRAPIGVRGAPLRGIDYEMPMASAQVKSAIALAALYAEGETVIHEPGVTRDHTERMLRGMGADLDFGESLTMKVRPLRRALQPMTMRVPGDISGATAWLVAGVIHPDAEIRIAGVGINPTRTGIIDALKLMGADIDVQEERTWGAEPVADIVVRSSRLQGAEIGGEIVTRAMDELPLLALAGCFAEGETVIRDAAELRVKESDRVATTTAELLKLGADIEATEDGFRIHGTSALRGANVASHDDHRTAMMLAVAGAAAHGETVIGSPEAVEVSYPWFWRDLEVLTEPR